MRRWCVCLCKNLHSRVPYVKEIDRGDARPRRYFTHTIAIPSSVSVLNGMLDHSGLFYLALLTTSEYR